MMNAQTTKIALLLAASAVTMALTGCGGSDGNDGNPGEPGGEPAGAISQLNLDITQVSYTNGIPVVTVLATNEADLPVVGLANLEIKKALQLIPEGAAVPGNSANWQQLGATKTFVDKKNGYYEFSFSTFNADKKFDSRLTQRFNMVSAAGTLPDGTAVPVAEMVEDFDGQGNAPQYTKNIVTHDVCASCHVEGEKIYHQATKVETCISCHTQEFADGRGKPHVAFSHLIHNVHNANKAWGKNNKVPEVAQKLVQDNCQVCHVESDMLTEAKNWSRIPTMEVCSSCHVKLDLTSGKGHPAQKDNSMCITCHKSDWTKEIHTGKTDAKKVLINQYGINTTTTVNPETQAVTVRIGLTDTQGTKLDFNSILPQIQRFETYINIGPNNLQLGYPEIDKGKLVTNGVLGKATIEAGELVYTSKPQVFGAAKTDTDTAMTFVNWAMCSENGQFIACLDPAFNGIDVSKYTAMKADQAFATLSGEPASKRHVDSVNFSACADCHGTEWESTYHKGQYGIGFVMSEQVSHTNDAAGKPIIGIDGCATCHSHTGISNPWSAKFGLALEIRVHKTHAEKAFGLIGGNCTQCHNDFNLEAFKVKGAMEFNIGSYTTPITATCTSCHTVGTDYFKAHTKEQLEKYGAIIDGDFTLATQAAQSETCFYCHKPTPTDHTQVKM